MKRWGVLLAAVLTLTILLACGPTSEQQTTTPTSPPETTPTTIQSPSGAYLTVNPVETGTPIYGGTIKTGYWIPRTFDSHQYAGFGPTATLPVFNQLVMFDLTYKDTVLETIIGDLAESWETSDDGTEITFHLHQGVKWHDGVPFTADDVIYSLDKMTDINRSAISAWFPAYQSTEKINDYTVKVHLKYASAGFMLSLAAGESQIQPLHLVGTGDQTAEFMVGTGPFTLKDFIPGVRLEYERNPNYWKKDKYGNQLPYLDGIILYHSTLSSAQNELIARRLDILGASSGAGTVSAYEYMKNGAPELLWVKRERFSGSTIYLNVNHKPLDDIRVRRAMGLMINEDDLIMGYSGDLIFGQSGAGIFHPAVGLPKDEVAKLMGWDKTWDERVADAQQLMAEAGYADGFKLTMMSAEVSGSGGSSDMTLVLADALRKYLKIDVQVSCGLGLIEIQKRLDGDEYDTYSRMDTLTDPGQLDRTFTTGAYGNWSKYSNTELDKMIADYDHILDPEKRREATWDIERVLLTNLPALPTGCYIASMMPYYPELRNFRVNNIVYSNINRFEDVWLDESLRVK